MANKEIPYFIQIEGCSNCKVNQAYLTSTGTFYEEGHTLHAKCIHMGCDKHGHNIEKPFIAPQELIRIGKNLGLREPLAEAKKVIVKFFDFYDTKGNLLPWVVEAVVRKKAEKPFHVKVAPTVPGAGDTRSGE